MSNQQLYGRLQRNNTIRVYHDGACWIAEVDGKLFRSFKADGPTAPMCLAKLASMIEGEETFYPGGRINYFWDMAFLFCRKRRLRRERLHAQRDAYREAIKG